MIKYQIDLKSLRRLVEEEQEREKLSRAPELDTSSKISIIDEKPEFQLEGKNFHPETKIKLRKDEKIYILERSSVNSSENATATVNTVLRYVEYGLVLENPNETKTYPKLIQMRNTERKRSVRDSGDGTSVGVGNGTINGAQGNSFKAMEF